MSRGITTAAATAVSGEVVTRTIAAELEFPSQFVRVNASPVSITIGGNEFLGVAGFGGVSAVSEDAELRAYDLTLTLSGVPRDTVALALAENWQGRSATLWEVPLNSSWQPIADPLVLFRGRMQQMNVSMGETATIAVVVENRLADWDRPRIRRYTDEDQRRVFPNDGGLKFVVATVEKQLNWPGASFWDRQR